MLTREQAAKYLVVAWCRDWYMNQYLDAIVEENVSHHLRERLLALVSEYPWLPSAYSVYQKGARDFIAGAYPKLSAWLWAQKSDADRLKCASQIERLTCSGLKRTYVSAVDRAEMLKSKRDAAASTAAYRLSRESFKTNQRSAWNVCKA